MVQAPGFARQVDARLLRKAKGFAVLGKGLRSQQFPHMDKEGVAGIAEAVVKILQAMSRMLPAADASGNAFHRHAARTGKGALLGDYTFLQAHGAHAHLEYGAGVIGIAHRLVPPLFLQGVVVGLVLFILRQGIYLFAHLFVIDGERIVGVVIPLDRQTQDAAGIDVHHDGYRAVLDLILFDALLQVFFQDALHRLIDGQHQVITVFRTDELFVFKGHVSAQSVFR